MRQKAQSVAEQPKHVSAEQNSRAKHTTGDAVGKEVMSISAILKRTAMNGDRGHHKMRHDCSYHRMNVREQCFYLPHKPSCGNEAEKRAGYHNVHT